MVHKCILSVGYEDIIFIVLSQPNSYHVLNAHTFREHLNNQVLFKSAVFPPHTLV